VSLKSEINPDKIPQHIAIIMDGNGRWAKSKGFTRIFGHQHGVKAVRETTEACVELGVKYLTLYTFSSENWNRPKYEVDALMELLIDTVQKETDTFMKNEIKLSTIGCIDKLPLSCQKNLAKLKEDTKNNTRMEMILALSYGSKDEIIDAVKSIAADVKEGKMQVNDINNEVFASRLYTKNIPDPELLIRSSGEHRISNFLLWQIAYSELYFTDVLWPDFRRDDLYKAIISYQTRERRFGKTSEQIVAG
jgi:undecaprenyl diphosphate synthase